MAFDFVATRADADEAIRDAGGAFVLSKFTDDLDIDSGDVDRAAKKYAGAALALSYENREIDGSIIQGQDIKFMLSAILDGGALMPTPPIGAEALFGGVTYEVINCKPFNMNGADIVYFEVQGRAVNNG